MHYFIQIHETGDPSASAVIESVSAYCDTTPTELEATETDAISEAMAVNDVAFALEHDFNKRGSNGKGKRNETFNYIFSFIINFNTFILLLRTILYTRMIVVINRMAVYWEQLLFASQTKYKFVLPRHHHQLSAVYPALL